MTISSLFGGGAASTPSILDRFDPAPIGHFQAAAFSPYLDRGGHEPEWPKSKSDTKGKTAMSALTLLAFLFFLNMLMSCLKETIANNEPEVVIMQQRAMRRARALHEQQRKGDLGPDARAEEPDEIDMDDDGDEVEGGEELPGSGNATWDGTNEAVGDAIDAAEAHDRDDDAVTVEDYDADDEDHQDRAGNDSEDASYETSLEKPETRLVDSEEVVDCNELKEDVNFGGGDSDYRLKGEEEVGDEVRGAWADAGGGWGRAAATAARSFVRRTYDVAQCKDLLACETARIAGVLSAGSLAEGFGDMLDWLFEESEIPSSWKEAVAEGRSRKNCQVFIERCTEETRGVSVLPVVAYLVEQFV